MKSDGGSVIVRVPGSTSNCGAGFDTLGLALSLYNRVTLAPEPGTAARPERAEDARALPLVSAAAGEFFRASGIAPAAFRYRIEGDVPAARGLGSSATIIVGVLSALDALRGRPLGHDRLAAIGTALEGNPENICAGLFGGFTVSRCDPVSGVYLDTIRVNVSEALRFVVVSPETEMPTKESRGVLPATLPFFDAVKSVNSAAYLTAAFTTGDFAKLRHAGGDFLHERYRLPRIPGAKDAIAAGLAAGALTGWLSGSGSSVLCVAEVRTAEAVSLAMRRGFKRAGAACVARVLSADHEGVCVESLPERAQA